MKKNYLAPEMSIAMFEAENVIKTSGDGNITAVQAVKNELESKKKDILSDSVTIYSAMEF